MSDLVLTITPTPTLDSISIVKHDIHSKLKRGIEIVNGVFDPDGDILLGSLTVPLPIFSVLMIPGIAGGRLNPLNDGQAD